MSSSHYTSLPPAHKPSRLRHVPALRVTDQSMPPGLPGIPWGKQAQVLAATPPGFSPTAHGDRWLRHVERDQTLGRRNAQFRRNVLAAARTLAQSWQYEHRVVRPGNDVIAAAVGVSVRTVQRVMKWLRDQLLVGWVQMGSTETQRGEDGQGNLANEYVLLLPTGKTVTPRRVPTGLSNSPSRAREEPMRSLRDPSPFSAAPNGAKATEKKKLDPWPDLHQTPRGRRDRLRAAATMRRSLVGFASVSVRQLRSIFRPYWSAGWTPADILWALDHTPDGDAYGLGAGNHGVRHPDRWLMWRLAQWLDDAGTPLPSITETRRAARAARVERAQQRQASAAAEAAGHVRADPESVRARVSRLRDYLRTIRQDRLRAEHASEMGPESPIN